MIMEKNRFVYSFDSFYWFLFVFCNLCCDKLKVRYFVFDKSVLFQRLVCLVYLIQRSYSEELYWKFDFLFEEKKNYSIFFQDVILYICW